METKRKRFRRDYAPLIVSTSIACVSSNSPLTQVFNASIDEYEPDRALSPTVIRPVVTARAKDGSWANPAINEKLADMRWYVNGRDITVLPEWKGLYSIEQNGPIRGSLTIRKNVAPGEKLSLHFEAVFVDTRMDILVPVISDIINISTFDLSNDAISMALSCGASIYYNPFLDKLYLYDYKVAKGLITADASVREAAFDGNEYLKKIRIDVFQGADQIQAPYDIHLYKISGNDLVEVSPLLDPSVISIDKKIITLDLRFIEKGNFMIKAIKNGKDLAKSQFSITRLYPKFSCSPTNETSILPGALERYDSAQASCEGKAIECPELFLRMIWMTDTEAKKGVQHNEGRQTVFSLSKTGIGNTPADDWIDIYLMAEQKPALKVATDENGAVLTDENGNILTFN